MYGNSISLFENSQEILEDIAQDFIFEVEGFNVIYMNLGLPFLSRPQKFVLGEKCKEDEEFQDEQKI